MFVYQPTFHTLDLKKTRVLIKFLVGNKRGVYTSKPKPLYTACQTLYTTNYILTWYNDFWIYDGNKI